MISKIVRGDGVTELSGIKSVEFYEAVNKDEDLRPGCVASAYIQVECFGSQSDAPFVGEALTYYQVVGETETLIGTFYAEPSIPLRNMYQLTAYDSAYKLEADFSTWLASHENSFPMTLSTLVSNICTVAGVTLSGTFPMSTVQVGWFYAEGITCREVLSWVAEIAGKFVRCDTSGNIIFDWYLAASGYRIYPTSGTSQDETEDYVAYRQDGLTYQNYNVRRVSAVAIQPSGVEGAAYIYPTSVTSVYATDPNNDGNVVLHNLLATDDENENIELSGDFDAYDTSGLGDVDMDAHDVDDNPMIISGNVLLEGLESATLLTVAQNIYNAMRSIPVYRPCKADLFPNENPLRAGDIVNVTDIQGVSFTTVVMNYRLTDDSATVESTGNEYIRDYVRDTSRKMTQLASDIVKIDKLKVNWAEIDTAVIGVLQANGIDADWINTGALTILDSNNRVLFKADKSIRTVQIAKWFANYASLYSEDGYSKLALESGKIVFSRSDMDTEGGNVTIHPVLVNSTNPNTTGIDIQLFSRNYSTYAGYLTIDGYSSVDGIIQAFSLQITDSNGIVFHLYGDVNVDDTLIIHNLSVLGQNSTVTIQNPDVWNNALGYQSGDSVTFGATSYTQFSGGCRANNAFNFTIPLSKPVASGVTASVSGSIVIYGDGHYRTLSMDDASIDSITVNIDGSGVTVHIVFDSNSVPSWYSAQNVFGIQAYNLTVSFI